MSFKKSTLVKLSTISHVCVGVILCHQTSTIIERILVLVCFGIIGGIQAVCINKTGGKTDGGDNGTLSTDF